MASQGAGLGIRLEALLVAVLLAFIPYRIARGAVTRLARLIHVSKDQSDK